MINKKMEKIFQQVCYLSEKDDGISKGFQTVIINVFYAFKNLKELT